MHRHSKRPLLKTWSLDILCTSPRVGWLTSTLYLKSTALLVQPRKAIATQIFKLFVGVRHSCFNCSCCLTRSDVILLFEDSSCVTDFFFFFCSALCGWSYLFSSITSTYYETGYSNTAWHVNEHRSLFSSPLSETEKSVAPSARNSCSSLHSHFLNFQKRPRRFLLQQTVGLNVTKTHFNTSLYLCACVCVCRIGLIDAV